MALAARYRPLDSRQTRSKGLGNGPSTADAREQGREPTPGFERSYAARARLKAHTSRVRPDSKRKLTPRGSKRSGRPNAGCAAGQPEFGRLKNEYGLTPLRVRGRERVALHADDLTMLAPLSLALARARAVPLAA